MFLVYYIAMVTVGTAATDWANDGLFGDGFHLFGIGTSAYEEVEEEYGDSDEIIAAYVESLGSKGKAIADAIDTETMTQMLLLRILQLLSLWLSHQIQLIIL